MISFKEFLKTTNIQLDESDYIAEEGKNLPADWNDKFRKKVIMAIWKRIYKEDRGLAKKKEIFLTNKAMGIAVGAKQWDTVSLVDLDNEKLARLGSLLGVFK